MYGWSGAKELYVPINFDATGWGSQQINTIGVSNPYLSESAANFRVFGIGPVRCGGARALEGPFHGLACV